MKQEPLEKWPIQGLGQREYKTNLEHYIVPESKEIFKYGLN